MLGEANLRRILRAYAHYYNDIRTHRSLAKDAPVSRPVQRTGIITSRAILGGASSPLRQDLGSVHTAKLCGRLNFIPRLSSPPQWPRKICAGLCTSVTSCTAGGWLGLIPISKSSSRSCLVGLLLSGLTSPEFFKRLGRFGHGPGEVHQERLEIIADPL